MNFTLADAAKKVGISRSSIYRLIDEGKLSASTDHRGKKVVELTELLRVFGSLQESTNQDKTQENKKHISVTSQRHKEKTGQDTLFSAVQELEHLRSQLQLKDMELRLRDQELELVKERMQDLKQSTEEVKDEKNRLLVIIERQTLLLSAPKVTKAVSTAAKITAPTAAAKKASKQAHKKPGKKA